MPNGIIPALSLLRPNDAKVRLRLLSFEGVSESLVSLAALHSPKPEDQAPFWSHVMGKKLYVGNLSYGVNDTELGKMFEPHGTVESAQVIMDRDTGRSKGFGFVEMKTDEEAQAAIAALNGKDSGGRSLTVNEAKPRAEGGRGGSGGRGGYGRGGGGGGYGGRRY